MTTTGPPAGRTASEPSVRRPREGSPDAYRAAWDADRNAAIDALVAAYNKLGRLTAPSEVWAERTRRALATPLRHALLRFEAMGPALGDEPLYAVARLLEWAANDKWRWYRKNGGGEVDLYQRPEAICGSAYEGGTGARQLAENWQRVLEWEKAERIDRTAERPNVGLPEPAEPCEPAEPDGWADPDEAASQP